MDKSKEIHINKNISENNTYKRIKLWNEDCVNKKERLKYWGRFDHYFKQEINIIDCRTSDFDSYCDYLNDFKFEN